MGYNLERIISPRKVEVEAEEMYSYSNIPQHTEVSTDTVQVRSQSGGR